MERMIAYCGLICTDCGAYIATRAKDQAAIERVAAEWRVAHNNPNITADGVPCDGCLAEGIKCFHCTECDIRACGKQHSVTNCAHCAEFPCERIQQFMGWVPQAAATLQAERRTLGYAE